MSHVENGLGIVDIIVFALYVAIIIGVGLWVSRDKKGSQKVQKIISSQGNRYLGGQLVHR